MLTCFSVYNYSPDVRTEQTERREEKPAAPTPNHDGEIREARGGAWERRRGDGETLCGAAREEETGGGGPNAPTRLGGETTQIKPAVHRGKSAERSQGTCQKMEKN